MNPDDLVRMLAESERRYAELAALVRQTPNEPAHRLMAEHAAANGMADWYAKWMPIIVSTECQTLSNPVTDSQHHQNHNPLADTALEDNVIPPPAIGTPSVSQAMKDNQNRPYRIEKVCLPHCGSTPVGATF